jgi:hypothetical protein
MIAFYLKRWLHAWLRFVGLRNDWPRYRVIRAYWIWEKAR